MKKLAAVVSLIVSAVSFATPHLVLFKQTEIMVSSLDHGGFQDLLQTTNQKNLDQLKQWIATRSYGSRPVGDLWLVRGAKTDLSVDEAKKLSREPWIFGVYEDKIRPYPFPAGPSAVASQVGELTEEGPLWSQIKIGLPQLQAEFPNLRGQGVRVGIIDTGIQANHPELRGKMERFRDFVNGRTYAYDDQGHGTHVAGTIAGNRVGIAPDVSLYVAKVFTAVGEGRDSDLIAAMQWMFDPDENPLTNDFPRIVSNSWGGDIGTVAPISIGELAPYQLALQAWVHGGIIPVFAAGNSGMAPNGFPGGLAEALAVGAINSLGQVADFSSRGPNLWQMGQWVLTVMKPDVSAPGVQITSSFTGNKYATWDGTSMATPHVSGALALLLQANPKLRYSDVKALLTQTVEPKIDTHFGYGILDAYKLVKKGISR
jgi:subtilisin family serine protease